MNNIIFGSKSKGLKWLKNKINVIYFDILLFVKSLISFEIWLIRVISFIYNYKDIIIYCNYSS